MQKSPKTTKSRLLGALKWLFTIAVVAFIFSRIPLEEVPEALRNVHIPYLLAALALSVMQRTVFALRWHILLKPAGVNHSWTHSVALYYISLFYESLAPSTVGADISRYYFISQGHTVSKPAVIASVAADRLLGLLSVVLVGLIVAPFVEVGEFQTALWIILGGIVAATAAGWLLSQRLAAYAPQTSGGGWRGLVAKISRKLAEMFRALVDYREHRAALLGAFAISCLGVLLLGVGMIFWCLAFGFSLNLQQALATVVMATVVTIVPITVGSVGVTEGAKVIMLGWLGMNHADALALAVLQRVAMIVFVIIGGILNLLRPRKRPA